jgi:hypothetical protein
MPLRVGWDAIYIFFEVGLVAMDFAAEALYYAADNGAKIASCSWGSENVPYLNAAIDYFVNTKGGLIFKAAGNDGTSTADYMAGLSNVISVAATDQNDCKASFSNYGSWVDISAPGVGIYSLWHDHTNPEIDYVAAMDGTSMATPMAASVAALIWSQDPGRTAVEVRDQLFASADVIDNLSCNSSYAGLLGAGRINAFNAVSTGSDPNDVDGDGYTENQGDCDDADPTVNPGAAEICDGKDNNCDGTIDEELTQATTCGVGACASTGLETCTDGTWGGDTCTPGSPTAEICNNIDDDCDGTIDEELTQATTCGVGACASTGLETCTDGTWGGDTCTPGTPIAEICGDGIDQNCDGSIDEGCCLSKGESCTDDSECCSGKCRGATGKKACR